MTEPSPILVRASGQAHLPAVARIAHRGGNDRQALRLAVDAGVDWLEIDLWYSYGRLIARHEWGFGRLPIVYDNWRLHILPHWPIDLEEIIRLTEGGPRLFIDLKGRHRRLPKAIVSMLRKYGATDRAAVCGQHWPPLDAIAAAEPRIQVFHSFGRPEQLDTYTARLDREPRAAGVSVARWLLTPELIERFHRRDLRVFAWTVNEHELARRLAHWGVDGIISDQLDLLRALP